MSHVIPQVGNMSSEAEISHTQTYIYICTEYMQIDDAMGAGDNNNHTAFFKERMDLDMLI